MAMNVAYCPSHFNMNGLPAVWLDSSEEVTVAASVNQSAAFPSDGIVRVYAAENTRILIGANPQPVAAGTGAGGVFVPSGTVEYFRVKKNDKVGTIAPS